VKRRNSLSAKKIVSCIIEGRKLSSIIFIAEKCMSFPFFSKDEPIVRKNAENMTAPSVMRTMRGDIEAIKNGTNDSVFFQNNQEERMVSFTPGIPSKSSIDSPVKEGNPFREYTRDERQIKNPFGVTSTLKRSIPGVFSQATNEKSGVTPMITEGEIISDQPKGRKNIFIVGGIVMIILLLVSTGGYYYFFVAGKQVAEPTVPENIIQKYPSRVAEDIPKELPYALDKANYLSVNTEVVSPADIEKILFQVASRIKEASITQPIEFLITDQNNNPIAFNRFVFLLKLEIAPDILALIDETFSLYAYNDAGNVRLGLDLKLKDQPALLSALPKKEDALPYALRALILEQNVNVAKTILFKSNTYTSRLQTRAGQDGNSDKQIGQEFSLRYANIDISRNLSVDYVITNNHWYIGMSRNTLRVLLDTVAK